MVGHGVGLGGVEQVVVVGQAQQDLADALLGQVLQLEASVRRRRCHALFLLGQKSIFVIDDLSMPPFPREQLLPKGNDRGGTETRAQ